ncbi:MAG: metal-dependent hydrolase [Phycisphaerales bacterium]|nr:TatD family hydrolase [Phycisphaerae bacterium]NNF42724.1 metal-dependent hydrolase [Phycisphaerales bacterium]NNM25796.1 metal-dependent hydrolase [Phycisphaerales bacterium]
MKYIDPHIHMISRTTDDYQRMAQAGCVAVTEPAFWAGFDRSSPRGFFDYFTQLTEFEPARASAHGIRHYCWICINPKEAEDPVFAREVMSFMPEFLERPTALGVGEIGLNKNSRNELTIFEEQVALAADHDQLILIHTPHLEDKLKGTRLIIDALKSRGDIDPGRVLIDHVEEHTVELVLDEGFWAGMTLYPDTKMTPQRAADVIETYGQERIWINSAGDWGTSDPLAVPKTRLEMQARGHAAVTIDRISFDNPNDFLRQSGKFLVDA